MSAPFLHFDCPTGLAGDMLLGALADLGVPEAVLNAPLEALGLAGQCRIVVREGRNGGLRGLRATVEQHTPQPRHRHWRELRQLLAAAPLQPAVQAMALRCFERLAEAEAVVHGCPPEAVHFHEVGALDAVADVLGTCAGLQFLGATRISCSPLPAGHGTVSTDHGLLPVPAPAVLELARRYRVPLLDCSRRPPGELVTPTGLALATTWCQQFAAIPDLVPTAVGIGLGERELDRPNQLRLLLAAPVPPGDGPLPAAGDDPLQPGREWIVLLACQIDDMDGEALGALQQQLLAAGARDVWLQPVQMKKQRPGQLLQLLAHPRDLEALRLAIWHHSTTIGLREQWQQRWVLPRRIEQRRTPLGPVRIKWVTLPDGTVRGKADHDDLAAICEARQLPLQEVRRAVLPLLQREPKP